MDRFMKKFFTDFESLFNGYDYLSFHPINIVGETKTEKGQDSNGEWVKQTFTSKDGSYVVTSFVRTSNLASKNSKEPTSSKIDDLKVELQSCVEKQDFEKAAKLRDKIKEIENNKQKLDSFKKELADAVNSQNFEKAIILRDKIKELEK